jgi:hypothetical protein
MTANPETAIQKAILCKLSMYETQANIKVYRMNNGAVYNEAAHAFQRVGPWHPHGLADIMVLHGTRPIAIDFGTQTQPPTMLSTPGGVIFLEVKTLDGVQSSDQKEFQSVCDYLGIVYAVVRSPKDAMDVLRKAGVLGGELDRLSKGGHSST